MSMIEQYGLTADVALVVVMFLALFAGYTTIGYAAIVAFAAIGLVQVAAIRQESA